MRLLPDSIAGRIAWLLVIGLVVTAAATYLLSGWDRTSRVLERIAVIGAIADRLPADARSVVVPAFGDPDLAAHWEPGAHPPAMAQDFLTRHLAHDVRSALQGSRVERVEAGRLHAPPDAVQVWIGLSDGTWLEVVVPAERLAALGTVRFALALGVLVAGIVLLAAWAARRVTAPLRRFAVAAERLGADVNAPFVTEAGPSEIRHAAGAFNRMQARILRLVEERTLMFAAMSHDLRSALARLRLRLEYIRNTDQRRRALADLHDMEAMLDSTLSFAREDARTEEIVRLDLAVLLQGLCDDLADAGKPVTYDGPARLACTGRPLALRRVFANLVDNALAYGLAATVSLARRDGVVEVTVGDRGPGIPQADRERVFAPFFRLEPSRSRETGGTGLGLTVARAIVRRHGGDVALEDRPGGGLLVRVRLPAGPA